jgi:hypothetical protein
MDKTYLNNNSNSPDLHPQTHIKQSGSSTAVFSFYDSIAAMQSFLAAAVLIGWASHLPMAAKVKYRDPFVGFLNWL